MRIGRAGGGGSPRRLHDLGLRTRLSRVHHRFGDIVQRTLVSFDLSADVAGQPAVQHAGRPIEFPTDELPTDELRSD